MHSFAPENLPRGSKTTLKHALLRVSSPNTAETKTELSFMQFLLCSVPANSISLEDQRPYSSFLLLKEILWQEQTTAWHEGKMSDACLSRLQQMTEQSLLYTPSVMQHNPSASQGRLLWAASYSRFSSLWPLPWLEQILLLLLNRQLFTNIWKHFRPCRH